MLNRKEIDRKAVVYDVDKIHSRTTVFRLHGKEHQIKPLTTAQFFEYITAYNNFRTLGEKEKVSAEDLKNSYFDVFNTVCDSITRKDVEDCSQQQAAVLFGVILEAITGKENTDEAKKKILTRANHRLFS